MKEEKVLMCETKKCKISSFIGGNVLLLFMACIFTFPALIVFFGDFSILNKVIYGGIFTVIYAYCLVVLIKYTIRNIKVMKAIKQINKKQPQFLLEIDNKNKVLTYYGAEAPIVIDLNQVESIGKGELNGTEFDYLGFKCFYTGEYISINVFGGVSYRFITLKDFDKDYKILSDIVKEKRLNSN